MKSLLQSIDDKIGGLLLLRAIIMREIEQGQIATLNTWFVYFMVDTETRKVKIGYTGNIQKRYLEIHGMNSGSLIIFHYELYPTETAAQSRETELHHRYADHLDYQFSHYERVDRKREWYRIEGSLKADLQAIFVHKLRLKVRG